MVDISNQSSFPTMTTNSKVLSVTRRHRAEELEVSVVLTVPAFLRLIVAEETSALLVDLAQGVHSRDHLSGLRILMVDTLGLHALIDAGAVGKVGWGRGSGGIGGGVRGGGGSGVSGGGGSGVSGGLAGRVGGGRVGIGGSQAHLGAV